MVARLYLFENKEPYHSLNNKINNQMKRLLLPLAVMLIANSSWADDGSQQQPFLGYGTEDSPYLIETVDDLRQLQQYTDTKYDFTKGKFFRLTSDIYINHNVLDGDGNLATDPSSLSTWVPIGKGENTYVSGYAFQGNFDGGGHTIHGVYINDSTATKHGLFGYINENGVVHDLNVADSYVCGTGAVGIICGYCYKGHITDCKSSGKVISTGATIQAGGVVGSVVGEGGRLLRCVSTAQVTGRSVPDEWGERYNCYIGGICGNADMYAKVDSCTNEGVVLADGWGEVGGIAGLGGTEVRWCLNKGYVTSTVQANIGGIVGSNTRSVWKCRNEGQVEGTAKGSCIGGIVGVSNFSSTVYYCENVADLISDVDSVFAGGIVGKMNGGRSYGTIYEPAIYNSVNDALIQTTSPKSQAGGISGYNNYAKLTGCCNNGQIVSASYAGGITPQCDAYTQITGCGNTGTVVGVANAGGIAGTTSNSIYSSWNKGCVTTADGKGNAGGIAGYTSSYMRNCFNIGEVCNASNVGGIAGYNNYQSSITSSYNAGFIHSDADGASLGGIGTGNGTVTSCYNAGTICANGNNAQLSGVNGKTWYDWDNHGNRSGDETKNCYNTGRLLALGEGCKVGNIVVNRENGGLINCYYLLDAIQGNNYTLTDTKYDGITALDANEFATLADKLNVKEYWWDDTPSAFVQGYCRPVLNSMDDDYDPLYYKVCSVAGDTTYVDLGLPLDNMFFRTDTTGMVLEAYNVTDSQSRVRRAHITDGLPLYLDTEAEADTLSYSRRLQDTYDVACLPFTVTSDMLPDSTSMYLARLSETGDKVMLYDQPQQIAAGTPFMLLRESKADCIWDVGAVCATIVPQPVADGDLRGTFSANDELDQDCYVLADGAFRLIEDTGSTAPFRAWIYAPSASGYDTLPIELDGGHPTSVSAMSAKADLPRVVYSLDGKKVSGKISSALHPGIFLYEGKKILMGK